MLIFAYLFYWLPLHFFRNAWSKSGAREARERCLAILKRMEDLSDAGRTELQPNTISFNTALDCLAQCTERDSARKAEQLLEHTEVESSALTSGVDDLAAPAEQLQQFDKLLFPLKTTRF